MPNLAPYNKCTGCSACFDSCNHDAIEMLPSAEGFLYPHINEINCTECSLCEKSCHVVNLSDYTKSQTKDVYYCWSKSKSSRKKSSSGGIFPIIANKVLDEGGVVFGVLYTDDMTAIFQKIDKKENLIKLQGSKYVQSDSRKVYREVRKELKAGHKVLFSGVPCHIAGLYSYLRKDHDNLLTIEIMCHGVPSPQLFKDYVSFIEKKKSSKVMHINFRNKLLSWQRPIVNIKLIKRLPIIRFQAADPYFIWFGKHYSIRLSCFNCDFRKEDRIGDFTLGDYWGIERIHPKLNSKLGISAVFVNSLKGKLFFEQIKHDIVWGDSKFEDVVIKNTPLNQNYPIPRERTDFFALWAQKGISAIMDKYPIITTTSRIKNKLSRIFK